MSSTLTRREFIKLSTVSLGGIAFLPFSTRPLPEEDKVPPIGLVRVTASRLNIRRTPAFDAEIIHWRPKDHLFEIWDEVHSSNGPSHNPRWYRIAGGYIHSGYTQKVRADLNPSVTSVIPTGQLMEITVPFTQSWLTQKEPWTKLYRLYYGSVHWVTNILEGPNRQPWYVITDDLLNIPYAVPAAHMRPIPVEEIAPISSHISPQAKRIQVSLSEQSVTAFEHDQPVFTARVSTGLSQNYVPSGEIPTETPTGNHVVDHKRPVRHMGDGEITGDLNAYELPGVPWVSYFYSHTGVAFHGTYWHDNFGRRMSHGCVNMRNEDAKWLFRWTMPEYSLEDWYKIERGTTVQVTA